MRGRNNRCDFVLIALCLVIGLLLNSCVTTPPYKRTYEHEYNLCQENGQTYQENLERLEKELALKTEMLNRFNLVDKDGNLRTSQYRVDNEKVPRGDEGWLK